MEKHARISDGITELYFLYFLSSPPGPSCVTCNVLSIVIPSFKSFIWCGTMGLLVKNDRI